MSYATPFELHPRLSHDTTLMGDLPLCRVLLMNDARFPWLVLVPRVPGATEIIDLSLADRTSLIEEIAAASRALKDVTHPEKLNVGAIGNIVSQLHVHVVSRSKLDGAWPAPVWGFGQARPYEEKPLADLITALWRQMGADTRTGQPA